MQINSFCDNFMPKKRYSNVLDAKNKSNNSNRDETESDLTGFHVVCRMSSDSDRNQIEKRL